MRAEAVIGICASLLFLIAYFWSDLGAWASCELGVMHLLGWQLWIGPEKAVSEADKLVKEGLKTVARIRKMAERLNDSRLNDIANIGYDVVEQLRSDPAKAAMVGRFVRVYLPGIAAVSEKAATIPSLAVNTFLTRSREACIAQQKALTADAVFDLDVEINVLQRRMAAEPGYQKEVK